MKAASRPFRAGQRGKCPIGEVHTIKKGDLIVRLKNPVSWIDTETARYGRKYQVKRYADYVHAECLEKSNK